MASASRPSLGADLELLPIEHRLRCVQVSLLMLGFRHCAKGCQSNLHSAADECVALVRHGIQMLHPVLYYMHVL